MSAFARLALAAGVSLFAVTAAYPQGEPAQEAALLASLQGQGEACGWLAPYDAEALKAGRKEQLAVVQAQQPAQAQAAGAAAEAAYGAGKAKGCAEAGKAEVQRVAQNMRVRLLLRAEAMVGTGQAFAYELTSFESKGPMLRQEAAAIRQQVAASGQGAAFAPLDAAARQEGIAAVAILCAERANVRSLKGPRPCPQVAPQDMAMLPYARAMVEGAEAFIPAWAAAAQASQQAAAEAQKKAEADRIAKAAADEKARKKAAADAAIAKHGDLSRYWRADFWASAGAGEAPETPAECVEGDELLDLGGQDARRVEMETLYLVLAPTVKLGDPKPPVLGVYSERTYSARTGKLLALGPIDLSDGYTEENMRTAFAAHGQGEDAPFGMKPLGAMYLDEFNMRALANSINGKKPRIFRQCRGTK